MRSLTGHPNTIMARDSFMVGLGVLLYCTASMPCPPLGPNVMLVRILFMVFTPISSLQLLCGKDMEESQ